MIANSVIRALWTNRSLVLNSAIILTLVGVSIWDSTVIINSFINDNRLTLVRTELANNSTRFLENITIRIFSSELPALLYEEFAAANIERTVIFQDAIDAILSGEVLLSSINTSTPEGVILALAIQSYIGKMDYRLVGNCLIRGKTFCNFPEYRNLSATLRNAAELEDVEKAIASGMFNYFMGHVNDDIDNIPRTIHSVEDFGITIEMDTVNFLGKKSIPMLNVQLPEQLENTTGSMRALNIYAGQSDLTANLQSKVLNLFFLDIRNLGIHDKTETTPCTNESEIISSNLAEHPTCDKRGFLKQIVKKCGCVPYSTKMYYRKFRDVQNIDPLFCDLEHYYDCSLDDGPIKIAVDDCPPSCITIRNQYTLSTVATSTSISGNNDHIDAVFGILSTDHSYVVFEDRFQLTTAQFIGQLGGDIGLYTGLSLLSIWQLIVFIHDQYNKYVQKSTASGKSLWIELSEQFNLSSPKSNQADGSMEKINGEIADMKNGLAKLSQMVTTLINQREPPQGKSIDINPPNAQNIATGGERIMSRRVLLADIAKMIQDEGRMREDKMMELFTEQRKATVKEVMDLIQKN